MQELIRDYLERIINAQSEVREAVIQASKKPGYQDFQLHFDSITRQMERILKAVNCIEQIKGGKLPG